MDANAPGSLNVNSNSYQSAHIRLPARFVRSGIAPAPLATEPCRLVKWSNLD
jgi:hypothetical protein